MYLLCGLRALCERPFFAVFPPEAGKRDLGRAGAGVESSETKNEELGLSNIEHPKTEH